MATMKVHVRLRVDPVAPRGEQETINADLLAMVDYLALPTSSGSAVPWSGNQADLDVEYDPLTGLHERTDLVMQVRAWFDAYAAHLQSVRENAPQPLIDVAPTSQSIYYYWDEEEQWCSFRFATYLGAVDAANEWVLQIGDTRAHVRIGVRYPMLRPSKSIESLVAGGVA